ncbi:ATP-grasp domain-containing protein [Ralstonia pickettii]|uniref:ATP-grasp domain-containing protein n=1 Tax=Ralstonia pickettii TaxID=329 RepID=A0AAW4Q5S1_RALPI|nr:ATP-grasp domain-containing protein [Ralstonia pickettii]MBA9846830.1 DUF4343 domain-containing protein [Ralstonia pickettii]MBA9852018.1 DUF4343 domain-containing protein [Ralstonia pickettii]MBA9919967.1 DUF4343 domain-containing protein [Ralstonia pickettii]MBA9959069.1 DUF4343 domain-containing protein [Ralstonia pickettii]MBA9964553.1 DUF4343 domain-containing protein [Ralstonia pickettii]
MADLAISRGISVVRASPGQVERGRVSLGQGCVAVGSVPFVKFALRQLGVELPDHTPYPSCLEHFLYRKVKRLTSLREARDLVASGKRLFIKPADGWKRFTGFVAEFADDPRFNGQSKSRPVWISNPVRFASEWRAYVADGELLELRFADLGGDRTIQPDGGLIRDAVGALTVEGRAPAGYVIDFGVLDTGETALIEMNDGFSFGAYDGVSPETYWKVVVLRWQELTA